MDQNIMEDFLFRVQNDGTMDLFHMPCRSSLRHKSGFTNPVNLKEAYQMAEAHLLDLCPGGSFHSDE